MSAKRVDMTAAFVRIVAAGIALDTAERARLEEILRDCGQIASFVESVRLRAITRLDELPDSASFDNQSTVAGAARGSRRQAQAAEKRATTVAQMPALADALTWKWHRLVWTDFRCEQRI